MTQNLKSVSYFDNNDINNDNDDNDIRNETTDTDCKIIDLFHN